MAETYSKKENRDKKAKKRANKAEKMEDRKFNNKKGKSLEDMMAYVDENGNITNTPPNPAKPKKEIALEDILLGAAPIEGEDPRKKGVVAYFSDKGYGFITEERTKERIFVHTNDLKVELREGDKVTFETERSDRGLKAINVEKVGA